MKDKIQILAQYLYFKYKLNFKTRAELDIWQQKQIKKFKNHILAKSEFYKSKEEYPIMDKQKMMDNFDLLNTVGIKKEEAFNIAIKAEEDRNFAPTINGITVGLSSGTSGNRGLFLSSDLERRKWSAMILYKSLAGAIFDRHKIAFFLRANSNLYSTLNQSGRLEFQYFDLTIDLAKHIENLNNYMPSILVAPAQILKILATAKQEGILQINPKKIISVAEILTIEDNNYISRVFNQTIHQIYQATEGFLGSSCSYGTIHLNEEFIYFEKEWLDEQKTRFMPIIHDFTRTSQPIWRYKLNDILVIKQEACPCGSHNIAIEMIEGRCDDVFYFKDKSNKLIPIFPDLIRRSIILTSNKIQDYRVIQPNLYNISVTLQTEQNTEISNDVQNHINHMLSNFHIDTAKITIEVKFIDHFEYIALKKLRRIERRFEIE